MSGAPNQRRMTQAEMAYTSVEAGKRAERRAAILERRLATVEERLAEQDRATSELARAIQDASDMASALHVVVKELQQQGGEGGSEALAGLDQRLRRVEVDSSAINGLEASFSLLAERLRSLESQPQPKRGRPRGSKNKPKPQTVVVKPVIEKDESADSMGQQLEGE